MKLFPKTRASELVSQIDMRPFGTGLRSGLKREIAKLRRGSKLD